MKRTDVTDADADLLAVGLVGNAIDLLDIVRVGDDLVASKDVLRLGQQRVGVAWEPCGTVVEG